MRSLDLDRFTFPAHLTSSLYCLQNNFWERLMLPASEHAGPRAQYHEHSELAEAGTTAGSDPAPASSHPAGAGNERLRLARNSQSASEPIHRKAAQPSALTTERSEGMHSWGRGNFFRRQNCHRHHHPGVKPQPKH